MSIVSDNAVREELRDVLWQYHQDLRADRSMEVEAQTLEVIRELLATSSQPSVSIKAVTEQFCRRHGRDYERITPKWIGTIIRKRLHLRTHKSSGGIFVISQEELQKLPQLYEKYGVTLADDADEPASRDDKKTDFDDNVDVATVGPANKTSMERS